MQKKGEALKNVIIKKRVSGESVIKKQREIVFKMWQKPVKSIKYYIYDGKKC